MTEHTTLTSLKAAREALVEYGWIQGDYGNKDTGFCAVGALLHARNSHGWMADADELRQDLGGAYFSVVEFNDNPLTDKVAVLDLYDRTIARLEQAT